MVPIEFNEKTGEPFIQLKSHPDIIVTPLRFDDVPHMVELLTDEKIIQWLSSPSVSYDELEGKCEV